MAARRVVAFFGHHKCATSWVNTIARAVCLDLGLRTENLHNESIFGGNLPAYVAAQRLDIVAYTNADISHARTLGPLPAVHVVRDPRDVAVSAYFSHMHSHATSSWPELQAHRERLHAVPKDEGLFLEFEYRRRQFEQMRDWDYGQPNVLELRMERLIAAPFETMVAVFAHWGLVDENAGIRAALRFDLARLAARLRERAPFVPLLVPPPSRLPIDRLLRHLYDYRFARMAGGRETGQEDVHSHYRKGEAGDWKHHFTPAHVAWFKRHYNDVLLRLGYETTPDW